ncbi:hypothetical protein EO92_08480 [Methanosarcina sp. 2.H.A.1B.4]|nr:hypothetical protein EO92_08480 [Methanosarcina sp. 2.H.A.1B.4]
MWKSFVIGTAEAPAGSKVNNINTTETDAITFKIDFLLKLIFFTLFAYFLYENTGNQKRTGNTII